MPLRDCQRDDCKIFTYETALEDRSYLHASCTLCGLADTASLQDDKEGAMKIRNKAVNALRDIHTGEDESEE